MIELYLVKISWTGNLDEDSILHRLCMLNYSKIYPLIQVDHMTENIRNLEFFEPTIEIKLFLFFIQWLVD